TASPKCKAAFLPCSARPTRGHGRIECANSRECGDFQKCNEHDVLPLPIRTRVYPSSALLNGRSRKHPTSTRERGIGPMIGSNPSPDGASRVTTPYGRGEQSTLRAQR